MRILKSQLQQAISTWYYDLLNGISWAAILSWAKYFLQHFIDIGWSVACAVITTVVVHYVNKWLKRKDSK